MRIIFSSRISDEIVENAILIKKSIPLENYFNRTNARIYTLTIYGHEYLCYIYKKGGLIVDFYFLNCLFNKTMFNRLPFSISKNTLKNLLEQAGAVLTKFEQNQLDQQIVLDQQIGFNFVTNIEITENILGEI